MTSLICACLLECSNIHGEVSITCNAHRWNINWEGPKNKSDKHWCFWMQILLYVWRKKKNLFTLLGKGCLWVFMWDCMLLGYSSLYHHTRSLTRRFGSFPFWLLWHTVWMLWALLLMNAIRLSIFEKYYSSFVWICKTFCLFLNIFFLCEFSVQVSKSLGIWQWYGLLREHLKLLKQLLRSNYFFMETFLKISLGFSKFIFWRKGIC